MAGSVFELFDELIKQTRLGNLRWEKTDSPHEYIWSGPAGAMRLTSVDRDGMLPIRINLYDEGGMLINSWEVEVSGDPEFSAFDDRAKALWFMVAEEHDVIARMVRDLKEMPPF